MAVRPEYRTQIRTASRLLAATVTVRLTKRLAEAINGFDLSKVRVGDVLTVARRDGQMLIAEGWAVPCAAELPQAEAADACGTALTESVEERFRSPTGARKRTRRRNARARSARHEWKLPVAYPVNALLVGSADTTRACLRGLLPQLRAPIVTVPPRTPLVLPAVIDVGTVILHDVGRLARVDQQQLVEWLDEAHRRTYVITTSRRELVSDIADGTFLDTLYYRLNMLYFEAAELTASERQPLEHSRS